MPRVGSHVLLAACFAVLLPSAAAAQAPGAPGTPVATVSGHTVTITWSPPVSGGLPTHYLIVAGTTAGGTDLGTHHIGPATTVTATIPAGVYFIRVVAVNSFGAGPQSPETSFTIAGVSQPPGAPGTPVAAVAGNIVTISWTAPTTGGSATHYLISAGRTPGGTDLGVHNVGPSTSVRATLPNGVYFVRVAAANSSGQSGPSEEVSFTIGAATQRPDPPGAPNATINIQTVTVSWTAPTTGPAPTHYVVIAGTSPGASDLGSFNVGPVTSVSAPLGPGIYFVRVLAVNAGGQSDPSAETSFTVGGGSGGGALYDGTWQGTSNDGQPFAFAVSNARLTMLLAGGLFNGGGCPASAQATVSVPIANAQFAHTRANTGGTVGWSVQGTFASGSAASGTLNITANPSGSFTCSGTVTSTWTATNFGVGAPLLPRTPRNFSVTVSGTTANFAWAPTTSSDPIVSSYALEIGTTSGDSDAGTFTFNAPASSHSRPALPSGVYFARLRARNQSGVSAPTAEVSFTIITPAAPSPPINLNATVSSSTATLTWSPAPSGPATTSYSVEIGTTSGATDVGVFATSATTFLRTLTPRTYFARVRGRNSVGVGAPSAEVTFTINVALPGTPGGLQRTVSGSTATFTWSAPASGGAVASYDVELGTASGSANVGVFNTLARSYTTSALDPGTYFARVRARNATGTGAPSAEVTFVIAAPGENVNGTWQGTTSEGFPFAFIVTNGAVRTIVAGGAFNGGACSSSVQVSTNVTVSSMQYTHTRANTAGTLGWTIQGTFASGTAASGSINVTANPGGSLTCSGTINSAWIASNYGVGAPLLPRAPNGFNVTVSSSTGTANFNWFVPSSLDPPVTSYALEIGTTSGDSDVGEFTFNAPATSHARPGLESGTYFARLRARNSSGEGPASREVSFTVVTPQAPEPAVNLAASVTTTSATLTWSAAPSGPAATSYTVEIGRETGASDVGVFTTLTRSLTRTLPAGTYFARVRGRNAIGIGEPSAEISFAIVVPLPGAPSNLQRSVSGSTATFTWSAPTSGGAVASYDLEIGTTTGGIEIGSFSTIARSFTTGTLDVGTYFVRVRARNVTGAGAASAELTFVIAGGTTNVDGTWQGTTSDGVPIAFIVSTGQVRTIVAGGAFNGGSCTSSIQVNVNVPIADLQFSNTRSNTVGSLGWSIQGSFASRTLASGLMSVTANPGGSLTCSGTVNTTWNASNYGVGAPLLPRAPNGFTVSVNSTTGTANFTWFVLGSTDPPVTSYALELGTTSGDSDVGGFTFSAPATSHARPALPSGTYFARLRARNQSGEGPASREVTFTIVTPQAPEAPTNLSSTIDATAVTLMWSAPPSGPAATSYTVEIGTSSGEADQGVFTTTSTTLARTLVAGTYFARVRGRNDVGVGEPSSEITFTVTVPLPGAPSGLQRTVSGSTATITWLAPTTGGAVSSYDVEVGTTAGGSETGVFNTIARTFTTGTLSAGTYFVRVRARNVTGAGAASAEVSFTITAATVGGNFDGTWQGTTSQYVPFAFIVADGQVTMILAGGAFNGGSCLASNQATVNVAVSNTQFSHSRASVAGSLGWTIQGTFGSAAVASGSIIVTSNPLGSFLCSGTVTGTWNATNYGVGAPLLPRAPSGLNAAVSGSTANFAWSAPGGSDPPITSYALEIGTLSGANNVGIFTVTAPAVGSSVPSLTPGTYYARLTARNQSGTSPSSNEVTFTIVAPQAPGPPGSLVASTTTSSVTLNWTAPTSGGLVESYDIELGTSAGASDIGIFTTSATTFTRTLSPGTYVARVRGRNNVGAGTASNQVTFTINVPVPGPPTNLQRAVSGSTVTFTWAAPTTGGAPASYDIEIGTTSGSSNTGIFNTTGLSYTTGALTPGDYFARIKARNVTGVGPASSETTFSIVGVGGNFDGTWQGTTSQNVPIAFIVTNGQVTMMLAGGSFNSGTCVGSAQQNITVAISNAQFSHVRGDAAGTVGWSIQGTFSSGTAAVGSISTTATPSGGFTCSGTVTGTWTASNYGVGAPLLPRAPSSFAVSISGTTLNFSWAAPGGSDPPVTSYALEVGTSSGATNVGVFTVSAPATSHSRTLAAGTYFARLRAVNPSGASTASTEVMFAVAALVPPGAPTNLAASVSGLSATLTWSSPTSGGTPTSYDVEIGTSSGASNIGTFSAGSSYVANLPVGVYFARVRARNTAGIGPASNEITFTIGTRIRLQWDPPTNPPSSYDVEIGTTSNGTQIGVFNAPTTTFQTTPLANGVYYIRVRSRNSSSTSSPSNEIVVNIPLP